ncbi:MAG: hypothetical protein LBS57_09090 [Treponema sp.]|jgi:hypothetical protein|nr:hypothetical protein [Treponema sp.]
MSDNKYKIFRNFMVNELGISREDIREWTMQAAKETVEKELRGVNVNKLTYDILKSSVMTSYGYGGLQKEVISEAIRKTIAEKLEISIRMREDRDAAEKT